MGRYAAAIAVLVVMGTSPAYAQDTHFVVMTTSADIHKAPSTGSAVIGKAARGKTFEVRRELGSWVSVSWPDAEDGVAYLHVAWGRLSHGAAVQTTAVQSGAVQAGGGQAPLSPATGAAQSAARPLSAAVPATESEPFARDVQSAQPPRTSTLSPSGLRLPSHVVGFGGRIGMREMGFAATGRAWTHGPLGLQIEAGQSTYTPGAVTGQLRSMQLAPSVIFSLPDLVTNALWVRPYAGGGINLHRATLRSAFGGANEVEQVIGSHIIGGAEFTSANVPQFAVSADLRQQWAPTIFSDTFTDFDLGGFGVAFSAHWYVK